MTNRLRLFCILALICIAASCSRVPKHIISERKMRVVLYDMLIAEAMVETLHDSFPTSDERMALYNSVFAKHQITQAKYDSSMLWYGKNLDLYMAIYKLTLKDINASIAALGEIKPNPISADVSDYDSIDIWIYNRSETFKPERVFNTLVFDILPQTPFSPGSSYVFRVSVWGIPPELTHKPKLHISAIQADTIITVSKDITADGDYEAIIRTLATKDVQRVYGYILMKEADAIYHRIYLNDIRLVKYKAGLLDL